MPLLVAICVMLTLASEYILRPLTIDPGSPTVRFPGVLLGAMLRMEVLATYQRPKGKRETYKVDLQQGYHLCVLSIYAFDILCVHTL